MIPLTCWHNPGSLEWIAAPLAWHIQRSAFERVCLWLLDMSLPTALNPICSKRVPIDRASAEDSDDIFKIPWNFTRNKLEPSPMRPIYIPIDGSWRQDFKHIIFYRFDTYHPKVMLPAPSRMHIFSDENSWCLPKRHSPGYIYNKYA